MSAISSVDQCLEEYKRAIANHPIGRIVLSRKCLNDFALAQWGDSVIWVPMLALMRDKVSSPRLKQALDANLRCESGIDANRSHVTLCRRFVESIGLHPGISPSRIEVGGHAARMTDSTTSLCELQISGWILASEWIVPSIFSLVLPQFQNIPEADTEYLREHIEVDDEEHARWMREAAQELLLSGKENALEKILAGAHLAGRAGISVLDGLYAQNLMEK